MPFPLSSTGSGWADGLPSYAHPGGVYFAAVCCWRTWCSAWPRSTAFHPVEPPDPEAIFRRTTELLADLVEPAKAEALETLGEDEQALGIASDWARAKLAPKTGLTADVASPDAP